MPLQLPACFVTFATIGTSLTLAAAAVTAAADLNPSIWVCIQRCQHLLDLHDMSYAGYLACSLSFTVPSPHCLDALACICLTCVSQTSDYAAAARSLGMTHPLPCCLL